MPGTGRRLLIVEDERLVGELLAQAMIAVHFEVRLATTIAEARTALDDFDPDVALLDIDLGRGQSGLHLGHLLAQTHPHLALVFLTRFDDLTAARADGIELPPNAAYLRKHLVGDPSLVVAALDDVLRERATLPRHEAAGASLRDKLAGKRLAVLRRVAAGDSNTAIAEELGLSNASVERYLVEIYKALGIGNDAARNPRVLAALRYNAAVDARELSNDV